MTKAEKEAYERLEKASAAVAEDNPTPDQWAEYRNAFKDWKRILHSE